MGGAGGVELRESSIRITFSYQGKQRKETLYLNDAPLPPTPANAKYARRVALEIKRKIQTGEFNYTDYFPHSAHAVIAAPADTMLFDVMDKWHRLLNLKASTKSQYRARLDNFWKKALKNKPVGDFKYSDILEALASGTWKSGKSRNNELSMIKQVFELAVRDKLIADNPCNAIDRASYQRPAPDPFTLDEVRLILASLKISQHEQVFNFNEFMFFTGLRTSEGIALLWSHVDFVRSEVLIEQVNVYDEEIDSTKTSVSRKVRLTSVALAALKRQKALTFLAGKHVFLDPETGDVWKYSKMTDVRGYWESTLKKVGVRYRRPYNKRHTYATVGLMSGANPAFLAKQLGHSLEMFFSVYANWINGDDDDREMAKIEASLTQNSPDLSLKSKSLNVTT